MSCITTAWSRGRKDVRGKVIFLRVTPRTQEYPVKYPHNFDMCNSLARKAEELVET